MKPIYFLVTDPKGKVVRLKYPEKPLVFGRQGTNYDLEDEKCSRQHCMISLEGDELILEDLSSKNGTLINGVRTTGCRVFIEDIITIGDSKITIDKHTLSSEWLKKLTYTGNSERRILGNVTIQLENKIKSKSTTSDTDVREKQHEKLIKK